MEEWNSGRNARLEKFEEFFHANEAALALELEDKLVDVEELKSLRGKATQYDKLKEELERSTAEKKLLKESNDRLSEELCARLSSRKQDFDEENKRILKELEGYKLQLEEAKELARRDAARISRLTPGADGRSSPAPSTTGESRGVSKAVHNELVKKFNDQFERLNDTAEARNKLEQRVRELKQQIRNWDEFRQQITIDTDRRNERISRQSEEIQRLRTRVKELEKDTGVQHGADGENNSRRNLSSHGGTRSVLKQISRGPALSAPPELISDSGRSSDSPEVITRNPIFLPSQYGALKEITELVPTQRLISPATSGHAHERDGVTIRSSPEPTLPQMPRVLGADQTQIASTQFVGLEPESHPASDITTEGSTEGSSPNVANAKPAEQIENVPIQESPETPVVVSSRRVKRKRSKEVTDSPQVMSRVKTEILSSSPIVMSTFDTMRFHESMDLDEIGQKIDTPKKRRQFEILRQVSGLSNVTSGDASNEHTDDARIEVANPPKTNQPKMMPPKTTSALQPLSPNRKILPRTSEVKPLKRRRVDDERCIDGVAEDGEIQGITKVPANKSTPQRQIDNTAKLVDLMEHPSPEKQVLKPSRTTFPKKQFTPGAASSFRGELLSAASTGARASRSSRESSATSLTDPGRRRLRSFSPDKTNTHDVNSPSLRSKPAQKTSSHKGKTPLSAKNKTNGVPFRNMPLESLGVEHFKVNPVYNGGYDFAFKNVVRGQDQRRELQGCIKPECCGTKFRILALELYREPQDFDARQNEEKIIKEFLGDNSWKIKGMLQDERKETMIQAMTRNLSNKFGKHRHAFARSKTPPGFWNADFPTTQEQELTREQQNQHERDLVELRYNEAMRPGGAYIFRDE